MHKYSGDADKSVDKETHKLSGEAAHKPNLSGGPGHMVKASRLNEGGDMKWRGNRKGGKKRGY